MKTDSFNRQAIGLISMLTLQYLLGMASNLLVQFPEKASENQLWEFAWKQLPLALHIILGILIAVSAIVMAVRVFRAKNQIWRAPSIAGLVAVLVAGGSGSQFVSTQQDGYSYLMAAAFLAAYAAYGWGLYRSRSTGRVAQA